MVELEGNAVSSFIENGEGVKWPGIENKFNYFSVLHLTIVNYKYQLHFATMSARLDWMAVIIVQ